MQATDKVMVFRGVPEKLFDLTDAIAEICDQSATVSQREGTFRIRGVQALSAATIGEIIAKVVELEPGLVYEGIVEE
jgi:hypothetical protein